MTRQDDGGRASVGEYATRLVVGVGGRAGVSVAEVCALVEETLRGAGLAADAVAALATVEPKTKEAGIAGAAKRFGVPLLGYSAEKLATIAVPHPSDAALDGVGTASVAEAAALAGGGELLVPKRRSVAATCAVATAQGHDLRHHGDAEVRDAGAGLVDLAVNVRTHTPPEWLKQRIAASLGDLAAYPDGRAARAAVAERHGLAVGRVLLTAGAAEAFVLIARALGAVRPVVVHPQFTEPEAALRDAGHRVERVVLRAADGFRLDPAAVPEDADLVVVGNPTNPTSVLHPAAGLAALARPGRILVVDEAFMDAVPGEREALAGRTDVPGLVVLRSLTKTWGLAGLRIGYVLAEPEVIAKLAAAQPLWPVSTPALVAAQACMTPEALAEAEAAARQIAVDRAHLLAGLAEFEEISVSGVAQGPFVLIRVPGAEQVRARLRALGFAVRRGDTFPGLDDSWLRLAVRDRPTTGRLLQALDHALTLTTH
ncbi:Rv2231c family pyridoxal phosphate-dependent protein CobC [Streptomyces sp. NPDC058279]|uniref:Rv2231c family pyridoxal phosphate-dependent protein CobC n=1 Tax=Streptomyces sp. NPDC058279 TaxID=3346418 RepID=UPI0036E5A149